MSIGIIVLPSPDAKWSSIALDLRGSDLLGQARELNAFQLEGACPRFWAQMSEDFLEPLAELLPVPGLNR